jgi:hypothetical protein
MKKNLSNTFVVLLLFFRTITLQKEQQSMWCLEHIVIYVFKLYLLTIEINCLMFTCGTFWFCVVKIKGWENITII